MSPILIAVVPRRRARRAPGQAGGPLHACVIDCLTRNTVLPRGGIGVSPVDFGVSPKSGARTQPPKHRKGSWLAQSAWQYCNSEMARHPPLDIRESFRYVTKFRLVLPRLGLAHMRAVL